MTAERGGPARGERAELEVVMGRRSGRISAADGASQSRRSGGGRAGADLRDGKTAARGRAPSLPSLPFAPAPPGFGDLRARIGGGGSDDASERMRREPVAGCGPACGPSGWPEAGCDKIQRRSARAGPGRIDPRRADGASS